LRLRVKPSNCDHSKKLFKLLSNLWRSSREFIRIKSFIPPANQSSLQYFKTLLVLFTNNKKWSGDKCPPCGTPEGDKNTLEITPNTLTTKCLSQRYEENQDTSGSLKPDALSTLISIL